MGVLNLLSRKGKLRISRYRHILSTLVKYGFGEVVYQTGTAKLSLRMRRIFLPKTVNTEIAIEKYSTWERLRMALEELGPTFIKLGQILSNRPDLVPRELQGELEKLQKEVHPFPTKDALKLLEEELGGSVEELFDSFEEEPVAAASIAQIHRARLTDGREVAVKIERPGLHELVEVDISILRKMAHLIEQHIPEDIRVSPQELVDEFEQAMLQELDFHREAASIERFASQFVEDRRVKIPGVYRNYSTRRILTMEYVEGVALAEFFKGGSKTSLNGARIAEIGADLTLQQIFIHGFFHADPHPGNILVLKDGRLCYLDFGLTGKLIRRDLETISNVLISIIQQDEQRASRAVIQLSGCRDFDMAQRLEHDIAELIDQFDSTQAGDFSFTTLLTELVDILVKNRLQLPPDLFLLLKTLITIEGVATALDPGFRFTEHLEPFVKQLVRERYDPRKIAKKIAMNAENYGELLHNFPGDYYKVVDTLAAGRIGVSFDKKSLHALHRTVLQASTALVFALVLSALIIGSALIIHSRVPPLWNQIPVIGIIGFIAAGLVGLWLLIKIIRSGGP